MLPLVAAAALIVGCPAAEPPVAGARALAADARVVAALAARADAADAYWAALADGGSVASTRSDLERAWARLSSAIEAAVASLLPRRDSLRAGDGVDTEC
jgi:predicted RNase H-like HicB family nuclease